MGLLPCPDQRTALYSGRPWWWGRVLCFCTRFFVLPMFWSITWTGSLTNHLVLLQNGSWISLSPSRWCCRNSFTLSIELSTGLYFMTCRLVPMVAEYLFRFLLVFFVLSTNSKFTFSSSVVRIKQLFHIWRIVLKLKVIGSRRMICPVGSNKDLPTVMRMIWWTQLFCQARWMQVGPSV